MNEKDKQIMKLAIDWYGHDLQKDVAIEEMAELTKELIKHRRGKDNVCDIADEIADVEIMLDQLKMIFKVGPLVKMRKSGKLKRLDERLNGEIHGN